MCQERRKKRFLIHGRKKNAEIQQKYNKNTNELEAAVCNCCGKNMKIQNGMLLEGICSVDTTWGYFSGKDLEKHEFDLCEECYDRITLSFAVPPEISEDTEV